MLADGIPQREIASRLGVSRSTVEADCRKVLVCVEVKNSHQLARVLTKIQAQGLADLGL